MHSGRRKADMRARLRQAAMKAAQTPHRQLGSQTKAALQQLAAAKQLPQALPALATLNMCTQYSKGCCRMVAGGLTSHVALIVEPNPADCPLPHHQFVPQQFTLAQIMTSNMSGVRWDIDNAELQ